jgi:outer membrane protein
MLKKLIASLPRSLMFAALCACSMAQAQSQAQSSQYAVAPSRIGVVFTERLMTESKMAKMADAKIQGEFSRRQKANEEAMARFKAASDKFDADAPHMNDLERTKRSRELYDMEKDAQRMQREFSEDLLQRKNEERAAIAQKAYKLIEQIAEQEHLDVVLQETAWSSPRVDITDKILKQLDK